MTTDYHDPLITTEDLDANAVNRPLDQLDAALGDLVRGALAMQRVNLGSPTTLDILDGAVTITGSNHLVDTEGGAASDDLDTINGGKPGDFLVIHLTSSARNILVKDRTGNIFLQAGDVLLDENLHALFLYRHAAGWSNLRLPGKALPTPGDALQIITPWTVLEDETADIQVAENLPQTYDRLVLEVVGRSNTSAAHTGLRLILNDTSGRMQFLSFLLYGGGAYYDFHVNPPVVWPGLDLTYALTGDTAPLNTFGYARVEFPHYTSATLRPAATWETMIVRGLTAGNVWASALGCGWIADKYFALTSLRIQPLSGAFVAGSAYALYGVKP